MDRHLIELLRANGRASYAELARQVGLSSPAVHERVGKLEAAGVTCTFHSLTGPVAETIVERATQAGSNMIYMGTRGMSALANMALGSVTTRVLHLCHIPVVLIH